MINISFIYRVCASCTYMHAIPMLIMQSFTKGYYKFLARNIKEAAMIIILREKVRWVWNLIEHLK